MMFRYFKKYREAKPEKSIQRKKRSSTHSRGYNNPLKFESLESRWLLSSTILNPSELQSINITLDQQADALGVVSLPRQMENLDRGVVAVHSTATDVYVGWRLLGTDPSGIAFNLYR